MAPASKSLGSHFCSKLSLVQGTNYQFSMPDCIGGCCSAAALSGYSTWQQPGQTVKTRFAQTLSRQRIYCRYKGCNHQDDFDGVTCSSLEQSCFDCYCSIAIETFAGFSYCRRYWAKYIVQVRSSTATCMLDVVTLFSSQQSTVQCAISVTRVMLARFLWYTVLHVNVCHAFQVRLSVPACV